MFLILCAPSNLSNLGLRPRQPRGCTLVHAEHKAVVLKPPDDAVGPEPGPFAGEEGMGVEDRHAVLDDLLRPTDGAAMNEESNVYAKSWIDVGLGHGIPAHR